MAPIKPNNYIKSHRHFLLAYMAFAFSAGFFISAFDVNVHSLFFEFFGYKYLATTYILGGFTGMVTMYIFTLVYKRVNTKTLSFLSITAIVLLTGVYLIAQIFWPISWIYYYGMVIFFPSNILLIITLWRYARKLFKPAYTRILLPRIKLVFFAGIAAGGGGFTLGLYFLDYIQLVYLTLLSLFILWISIPFLNYTFNKLKYNKKAEEKYIPVSKSFFLFFSSKNTRLLFLFAFLSAIVGFSVHFVFVNLAWVEFRNIFGMSKFYGLFTAVTIVFVFGIDRFLLKRILYSYDSPYSLFILPPLMLLGILFIYLSPFILGSRLSGEHFTLFFLIVSICKVGYITLFHVIQTPSLRTLFYSLDLRYRQLAYPRVEGSMIMAGLAAAGIVFLGLSFLKFFSVSIVIIFSGIVSIFWLWVTIKLIKAYRDSQEKELSRMRFRRAESEIEKRGEDQLQKIYSSNEPEKIIESLKIMAHTHPFEFENDLKRLILHPSHKVRNYILECIEKKRIVSAIDDLKLKMPNLPENEKDGFARLIRKLESITSITVTEQLIREKLVSGSTEEKIDIVSAISLSAIEEKESVLLALTKDYEPAVQDAAIKALSKAGTGDHYYTLIDYLYPGQYKPCAFDAIAASREKAVALLERESLLPGIDDITLTRIIKLYGRIGTKSSVNLLLSKMGEIDSHVLMQSIDALVENRFQAGQEDKLKIISHIVRVVGFCVNNHSICYMLRKSGKFSLLRNAYLREIKLNYQQLFKLLSLIYNPNIINALEKLFLEGNREEISHGIELADSYIDDDIKPLIFALFEDISDADRLKKLEYFFPQPVRSVNEIISSTLTYDFNALSIYPRACAIMLIYSLGLKGFDDELVFCANHPDELLGSTAKFVIQNRTSGQIANSEKAQLQAETDNLLYSRFTKLISHPALNILSENVLSELAKSMSIFEFDAGTKIHIDNSFAGDALVGMSVSKLSAGTDLLYSNNRILYLPLLKSYDIHELSLGEDTTFYSFNAQIVNELIYDNPDLSRLIFSSIDNLHIAKHNEQ